jgi:hypothetical protein
MKSKIAVLAVLIFLVGCKSKEIKIKSEIIVDSTSVEVKKEVEILTYKTDSGLVVEEEITDFQITTDSAGTKTSLPIKKIKKSWHKYDRKLALVKHEQVKAKQVIVQKQETKAQSVERPAFQIKWFVVGFIICLLLLLMLFLYFK